MIRRLLRLRRDKRGAAIVEMALLMPFLATVVVGVADISRAYSQKLILEQAAYRAIEKVQQYQSTQDTYNTLQNEVAAAATDAGFTDVATKSGSTYPNIVIDFWLECNGARQSTYDMNCTGTAVQARWISVDVTHKFWPMFAWKKWPGSNTDGSYTLHGRAGLRTQ